MSQTSLSRWRRDSGAVSCGVLIEHNGEFLLGHCTNTGFSYGIPKGKQEPGESRIEAAIREVMEETGIELHPENVSNEPWLEYEAPSGKMIVVFRAQLESRPPKIVCRSLTRGGFPEFDKFIWLDAERAKGYVRNNHMRRIFEELGREQNQNEIGGATAA